MELVIYISFALSLLGFLILIMSILKLYRHAQLRLEINAVSFTANIMLATALMHSSSLLSTTNTELPPAEDNETLQFSHKKPSNLDNAKALTPESIDHF
jgi:hypothetical protein